MACCRSASASRSGWIRIVNFAHGELVMYGMYAGIVASKGFGIDPLLILPVSFLFTALIGVVQYQVVFRHFVGHATLQQLPAAIGCALVLQMLAQIVFGADAKTAQSVFSGKYTLLGPLFLSQGADRRLHHRGCCDPCSHAVAAPLAIACGMGQGGARGR